MDEEKEQITKNQHYVPQFYLRKFVNEQGKLEILDCERRKIVAARTPRSVCNEEYFYSVNDERDEISQSIEKEFQRIETQISLDYDGIARKFTEQKQITDEDKFTISTFIAMQYLRGPYMRTQINHMSEKLLKDLNKMHLGPAEMHKFFNEHELESGTNLSPEFRNELIDIVKLEKYKVKFNNAAHLNILGEMSGFTILLFAKEWLVYISASPKKFITSDNPVLEIFPDWTGKFFYSPTFLQRTHQFAMTPEILIVATHPRNPPKPGEVKRKTLFDTSENNDKILEFNFEQPRKAMAYAYANHPMFLQEIVDSANLFFKQKSEKFIRSARINFG